MARAIARSLCTACVAAAIPLAGAAAAAGPAEDVPDCPPDAVCEEMMVEPLAPPAPEPASSQPAQGAVAAPVEAPPYGSPPWPPPPADDVWPPGSDQPAEAMPADGGALGAIGLAIFALGYAPAFVTGLCAVSLASDEDDESSADEARKLVPLLLPVAGPPISGALLEAGVGTGLLLAASAGAQVVGLTLMVVDWLGGGAPAEPGATARVRPVLVGNGHAIGLGVAGSF